MKADRTGSSGSSRRRKAGGGDAIAAEVERVVGAVYRELESRLPERACTARTTCCRFRLTGRTPMLTRGEAMWLAIGMRASGRRDIPAGRASGPLKPDGACPLLSGDGRCTAYGHRPFGCRTHFCEPAGGIVPRRDVVDLIRELEDLDARLGGDGPRPIEAALRSALNDITSARLQRRASRA